MTYLMETTGRSKPSKHRILMNFMLRQGWQISFLEENCRTTLKLKLTFATPDKILEMQERWGEVRKESARHDLEREIAMGRPGSVWLVLSSEQYDKLRRP